MATMSAQVTAIRYMLDDAPLEDYITDNPLSDSATTMTPNDVTLFQVGQVWEFNDGGDTGAEQVLIRAVGDTTVTIKRAHNGTTAASHNQNTVILLEPRFAYDRILEAYNMTLDSDLFDYDVFDIAEHQVTSSSTTDIYNAPTTSCERFLRITQQVPDTNAAPRKIRGWRFVENADTGIAANGAYAHIWENLGVAGTDVYYVECAHRYTLSTLSTQAERICQNKTAARLLRWSSIRRVAGPSNQGDRSVRSLDPARLADAFDAEYEALVRREAARIKRLYGGDDRRFIRSTRSLV